jgi:MFS family permease
LLSLDNPAQAATIGLSPSVPSRTAEDSFDLSLEKPTIPADKQRSSAGRAAFGHADFRYYWLARVLGVLAIDMQMTAVGWQVYTLTGNALDLGLIGLAQIIPFFLLFPVSGIAADRIPRKRIMTACVSVQTLCALLFFTLTMAQAITFPLMLIILLVLGVARSFQSPAQQAIVPVLVAKAHFANAVAWTAIASQTARIAGPGIAGLMIIAGETWVYGVVALLLVSSTILTFQIKANTQIISKEPLSINTVLAGFRFILRRQIILGVITLDLFAVLLGGATALLPIYAKDILMVGPWGFGILRAMHMVGAFSGALFFTRWPIRRHAGIKLLSAVGIFGTAIVVFGLSTNLWLSVAALVTLGAADAVSVFIRGNLVQIITPDDMRGRVTAVNAVFIGASNEFGEFESGLTAAWWGVVPAVVVGGVGTICVAVLFAALFPQLRRIDSLDPDDLMRRYR